MVNNLPPSSKPYSGSSLDGFFNDVNPSTIRDFNFQATPIKNIANNTTNRFSVEKQPSLPFTPTKEAFILKDAVHETTNLLDNLSYFEKSPFGSFSSASSKMTKHLLKVPTDLRPIFSSDLANTPYTSSSIELPDAKPSDQRLGSSTGFYNQPLPHLTQSTLGATVDILSGSDLDRVFKSYGNDLPHNIDHHRFYPSQKIDGYAVEFTKKTFNFLNDWTTNPREKTIDTIIGIAENLPLELAKHGTTYLSTDVAADDQVAAESYFSNLEDKAYEWYNNSYSEEREGAGFGFLAGSPGVGVAALLGNEASGKFLKVAINTLQDTDFSPQVLAHIEGFSDEYSSDNPVKRHDPTTFWLDKATNLISPAKLIPEIKLSEIIHPEKANKVYSFTADAYGKVSDVNKHTSTDDKDNPQLRQTITAAVESILPSAEENVNAITVNARD